MPKIINSPTIIEAAGNKPKIIEEFFGLVNTGDNRVSIARMKSPPGWIEPGQIPEFDEYTVLLKGVLRVESSGGTADVKEGRAILSKKGEWVRYSTPYGGGCEYLAVCLPAFAPETVHRDE